MFSIRARVISHAYRSPTCMRQVHHYNPHEHFSHGFDGLVRDLSAMLQPTSGLDASEIDHRSLQRRLDAYQSNIDEWNRYAFADFSCNYTRNLVDRGNGKFNFLLLVWSPGKGSPIHDHTGAHCVMKILSGTLKESLYEWPEKKAGSTPPLNLKKETLLHTNDVAYMSDTLGLHKMKNPDLQRPAVSLHLYTPPWAERRGSHMFEETTGEATHVSSGLYSQFGQRIAW